MIKKRKFPNLFIIGAPKCGTTSLARWLSLHPDVFFYIGSRNQGKVEPHYWVDDFMYPKYSSHEYFKIFDKIETSSYLYAGEASVFYLFSRTAIKNIEKNINNPMYIVSIRNPVEMAYSLWLQYIRSGIELESEDFISAFNLSEERSKGRFIKINIDSMYDPRLLDYKSVCALGTQLENLFKIIPRERVLILILDDIKENPEREWKKILSFLGLRNYKPQEFLAYNQAMVPRNKAAYKFYKIFIKLLHKSYYLRKKIKMSDLGLSKLVQSIIFKRSEYNIDNKTKKILLDQFLPEIEKLEIILQRQFDKWRT